MIIIQMLEWLNSKHSTNREQRKHRMTTKTTLFSVRTRKFWLRLAVLIFSVDFRLICSYFVLATTFNYQKEDSGWRMRGPYFQCRPKY